MAIVFISPKHGKDMLIRMGFVVLVMALAGVSALFLLPEIKDQITITPAAGTYTAPDISINFELIDSVKVQTLDSFVIPQQQTSTGRTDPFTSY